VKIALSDGTKLYFDVYGSKNAIKDDKLIEKPTILFLHGGPGLADHNLYVPFWSQFQDIAQVIFIDFRGHGLSEGWKQSDKFNLRSWGADVKDFCDRLGIEKPIVVGFSFGGWVALDYAITYPDHPGALILCNAEASIDVETRARAYRDKALRKNLGSEKANEIYDIVMRLGRGEIDSKKTAEMYIEHCAPLFSEKPSGPEVEKIWMLCKQNILAWEVFDRNEQFKFDLTADLHKIIAPVLSISGELDVEHPAVCAKKMCDHITNAEVKHVILKGVGDPVDHDDPEGVINAVQNFIFQLYPKTKELKNDH
jgi:proline iminopeptidase